MDFVPTPQERVNFAAYLYEIGAIDVFEFVKVAGIEITPEIQEKLKDVPTEKEISNILQNMITSNAIVLGTEGHSNE